MLSESDACREGDVPRGSLPRAASPSRPGSAPGPPAPPLWQTGEMRSSGDIAQRGPAGRATRPGHYGIDGGNIVVPMLVLVEAALLGVTGWALRRRRPVIAGLAGAAGLGVSVVATGYLYSSGRGKRSTWTEILDELRLSGSEHVLDVGCGRGAVLMLAAHRVPAGRAVGADIWRWPGPERQQSRGRRAQCDPRGGGSTGQPREGGCPLPALCVGIVRHSRQQSHLQQHPHRRGPRGGSVRGREGVERWRPHAHRR